MNYLFAAVLVGFSVAFTGLIIGILVTCQYFFGSVIGGIASVILVLLIMFFAIAWAEGNR